MYIALPGKVLHSFALDVVMRCRVDLPQWNPFQTAKNVSK